MGYSLGGDLSWALCKNNASMFKKAIISGSRCGYSKKGSIVELAKNKSRFYIAVGANENKDRIKGTKKAKTQLDNAAIKNKYYTIPNAGHDPLPKSKFKEALDFVMFN
jgi:predicted alpha/beta superfamily hydrolase